MALNLRAFEQQNKKQGLNLSAFEPERKPLVNSKLNMRAFGVQQDIAEPTKQPEVVPQESMQDTITKGISSFLDPRTGSAGEKVATWIAREVFTKPGVRVAMSLQRHLKGDDTPQEFKPGEGLPDYLADIEKGVFGDEPIADFKEESKRFAMSVGVSEEKAEELSLPMAVGFATLDILPPFKVGKGGALAFSGVAEVISKTRNVDEIVTALKTVAKGTDEEIKVFAEGFKNINNASDIEKILANVAKEQDALKSSIKTGSGGELPKITEPGAGDVTQPQLSDIEKKAFEQIDAQGIDVLTDKYIQKNKNIVDSDRAKEFIPGYSPENAPGFHKASQKIRDEVYTRLLTQNKGVGDNTAYFTSGGAASGKSESITRASASNHAIIYDTTLSSPGRVNDLRRAIDNGFNVHIDYTASDPIAAWGRVQRRGRQIPLESFVRDYEQSLNNVKSLYKEYKDNPNVAFTFNDNRGRMGEAKATTFDEINKIEYNKNTILKEINERYNTKQKINTTGEGNPNTKGKPGSNESRNEAQVSPRERKEVKPRLNPIQKKEALEAKGSEELSARQVAADIAGEERSLYSTEQIKDINRLKKAASAKSVQAGDIETLRKRNPELTNKVLESIKEANPGRELTDDEALDVVRNFPTKAKTVAEIPEELKQARKLSAQVKTYMQGVREGTLTTKKQVKDAQSTITTLINESDMELKDKGKFIATIKNVQTYEQLGKVFDELEGRINQLVADATKRSIRNDILKIQRKIMDSPSIAIDYKDRVKDLMRDFELKGKRESTLDRLRATQEFIQSEIDKGNDVEIPRRVLKSLELLNRTPFEQVTQSQLNGLKAELELIESLGRTKLRTMKTVWEIQKRKIIDDVTTQGAKPITNSELIKPEIGERLTMTQKMKNLIWSAGNQASRIDRAITPMDTIFDLLDGGKASYSGANFRYFKGQVDAGYGRYITRKDALQNPVVDLASKHKLDNRNFERIGVVAARDQDGGIDKLISSGYTKEQVESVQLSKEEQEVLDLMRETFDSQFPEIKDTMRRVYNQPVEKVKNYFSFMTDWKAMDETQVFERFGSQAPEQFGAAKKNVEAGFTKSRVGGNQQIKINALDVFLQHTDNTSYLLELGETTKMLGEVAASSQYTQLVGDAGQLMVREWLDVVARKGGAAGAQEIAILNTLRKNVGIGILGLKLSTVAIQPTALIDGMGFIGTKYVMKGLTNFSTSSKWRNFISKMPELADRKGGEFALRELTDKSFLESIQRKGFIPMQKMDQLAASAIAAGAYERKMIELGREIDFTKYDEEALAFAQLAVRRTQSSGAFKDVPLAVSRGALTGNRSLDRAMLQFQSFLLNRWSRIRHDAIRAGINTNDPKKAIPIFTTIVMAALAGSGIRLGVNKVQDFVTGKEDSDAPIDDLQRGFIYELTGNVPFVGTAVSMAMYDGEMFPILDAPKGIISGLNRVITSKSEKAKLRGFAEFAGSTGGLFGIPGSTQAEGLVRGALQDKKGEGEEKKTTGASLRDKYLKKKETSSSSKSSLRDRFLKKD